MIAAADSKLARGSPAASGCESRGLLMRLALLPAHSRADQLLRPLRQLIFPRHESVEPAFLQFRSEKLRSGPHQTNPRVAGASAASYVAVEKLRDQSSDCRLRVRVWIKNQKSRR